MGGIERTRSLGERLRDWMGRWRRRDAQTVVLAPDEDAPAAPTAEADDDAFPEAENLGAPSVLAALDWSVVNVAKDAQGSIWIDYLLLCKHCLGGDMFFVTYYPKIVPDPSPYAGWTPGATVRCAPYGARCIQCGRETTIFDPATYGHDGVLKRKAPDDIGEMEATDQSPAAHLYVAFSYRTSLEALSALASQADVAPADLFEAIYLRGLDPHGQAVFEAQYDCAE